MSTSDPNATPAASCTAKKNYDIPLRKAVNVNSTTRSRTPPPGASRRTFGTKPLYNAAGPSSRKMVNNLGKDERYGQEISNKKEGINNYKIIVRWVCPVILRYATADSLFSALDTRFYHLQVKGGVLSQIGTS